MFKLFKKTTIYVLCPAKSITGGPEALHQLVHKLTTFGYNVKIAYYPKIDNPMADIYKKYYPNIEYVFIDDVVDSYDNILIVPETAIRFLDSFDHIQRGIRRLSVNNSERRISNFVFKLLLKLIHIIGKYTNISKEKYDYLLRGFYYANIRLKGKRYFPKDKNIIHLRQSKYAENRVLNQKGKNINYPLSDYLNKEFIENSGYNIGEKEDIVAYNPKKGIKYTQKLIKNSHIKFVPIQNMSPKEVQGLLKKAKVYIDFGYHPGKDRMPRESAIQGCCIITNTSGAARFFKDIPIPNEYVFESFNSTKIIAKIKDIFENYDKKIDDFWYYRNIIKQGENIFENEVKEIFLHMPDKY